MGVIRPPRKVLVNDGRSTEGSDTNSGPNTDTESVVSSGTVTPLPGAAGAGRASLCPLQVRRGLGANTLRLKQGRRTKQRSARSSSILIIISLSRSAQFLLSYFIFISIIQC